MMMYAYIYARRIPVRFPLHSRTEPQAGYRTLQKNSVFHGDLRGTYRNKPPKTMMKGLVNSYV